MAGAMVIALLAVGPAAQATFPGHNGEIVYLDLFGVYSDSETEETLVQVCPSGFHERDFLPGVVDAFQVAFSPNGRMAASDGIFLAPLTGKSSRRLSRPPRRAADLDPVWSPQGGALAFTRVRRGSDFQVRSTAVRVYRRGRGRFLARGFAPAWSVRDRIAFVRGPYNESGAHQVHVASVRSGATRRLTTGYEPAWAPDGRRLVFTYDLPVSPEDPPATGIATISADGTRLRRLTDGRTPSWSPNGRWIGFYDPAGYVAVISPSGRGPRRLARSNTPPLFSPDSRWIAYTWHDELYVVPVKGGSRRFVTSPSEELELLDWRAAPASQTRCR